MAKNFVYEFYDPSCRINSNFSCVAHLYCISQLSNPNNDFIIHQN